MAEKLSSQISIRLPETTLRKLAGLAQASGKSAVIRELIEKAHQRALRRSTLGGDGGEQS